MVLKHLKAKDFYRYENLCFCVQDDFAVLDQAGKVMLRDRSSILKSPEGSGGVFKTFLKYDLGRDQFPQ